MNRLSLAPEPAFWRRTPILAALTVLFTLLNYMGSAFYELAGGLTTVKPYSGVALALILMLGDGWLLPVLATGVLGGILAKLATFAHPVDAVVTPAVTTLTVLAVYLAMRKLVGRNLDFRAWRQLVDFIAIATAISMVSATLFSLAVDGTHTPHTDIYWQAWFIPTALSYVIFTPVMVLLATTERRAFIGSWRKLSGCLLLMAGVLAVNFLPVRLPLFFAIPMALLVVTLISGLEGTALGLMLTQLVLTAMTALGFGASEISHLSLGYQLYFVQIYNAILILVMLPVAAAVAERVRLRDEMVQALEREAQVNAALRLSEQHALDLAAKAQAASTAKSEFLASMSHELRTPLNAILGFSEIISSQLYGPLGHEKYGEYAEDVFKSGTHLLDLINDVLDLSKIDAGKMELRESVFAVRELVDDTVHLVRDRVPKHVSIRVHVDCDTDILADRRLLKQVLLNLLSNAIKFTPDGAIAVYACEPEVGGLEISVSDTGIGMTDAQLEKAFSHYGQIDSKIAREHHGTGLGLPISQALARLHGGDLTATSTLGQGTRMTLSLPPSRIARSQADPLVSAG